MHWTDVIADTDTGSAPCMLAADWTGNLAGDDVIVDTEAGDAPCMLAADWTGNLTDDAGSAELRLPQLHITVSAEN